MKELKTGGVIAIVATITLVIGLVLGAVFTSNSSLGGVNFEKEVFKVGFKAGSPAVDVVNSSGQVVGVINLPSTATLTSAGVGTFSGANTFSGATAFTGTITASATSTFNGTTISKCNVTYDGATTTTAYYTYASGTSVVATTTKPALCQ